MPLVGTLSTMPLPDLLQWLGSARQTGTLHVERNKVDKQILFEKGRVIGCSSDDPAERLGHFLVSRGKITEDQLRRALHQQETSKKHLGMTLVEMGALSEKDLSSHLAAKAEEIIYSIFVWDDAVFRFEQTLGDIQNLFPTSLQVEDILLRGLKRWDEMQEIRTVFNDPGIVLRQTPRLPPPEVARNKMARQIYESIDGQHTVADILLLTHGSEYIVTKFLFELQRNGFVEVTGVRQLEPQPSAPAEADSSHESPEVPQPGEAPPAAPAAAERPLPAIQVPAASTAASASVPAVAGVAPARPAARVAAAPAVAPPAVEARPTPAAQPAPRPAGQVAAEAGGKAGDAPAVPSRGATESGVLAEQNELEVELGTARRLMSQGDFEQALEILDRLYKAQPQDEALRRLTAEAEMAFVDKAYRHYLPASKIPALTRGVDSLEEEKLSSEEFFLLSRIDGSWDVKSIIQIAPLREVDALRALKKMREKGIIELLDAE